jgi:6-phosphogluconolactonase
MQNPAIIIESNAVHMAQKGAEIFLNAARRSVELKGCFMTALSGGSTPRPMHKMLTRGPYHSNVPWEKTHIFWADERNVTSDHPDSNYGTAKKDLLEKVPIPSDHIHAMPVWLDPEAGIWTYQKKLEEVFSTEKSNLPVFDLIFLGVGTDGHTASLFPGQEILGNRETWIVSVKGGKPNVERLTMTYSILNEARHIVFLVSGEKKCRILRTIFEDKLAGLPVQRIQPRKGKLTWLIDQEAAARLPSRVSGSRP